MPISLPRIQWLHVTGCVSGEEYHSGVFEILFKVLDHTLEETLVLNSSTLLSLLFLLTSLSNQSTNSPKIPPTIHALF